MMIDCPKCGFNQPRDQYCARCGVDMIAFKPAAKPFAQRLLGSTLFQVSALILVIGVVFTIARHHNRRLIADRISSIENANTQVISQRSQDEANKAELSSESTAAATGATANAAPAQPEASADPSAQPASVQTSSSSSSLVGAEGAPPAPGAATDEAAKASTSAGGAAARAPTTVRIVFAEVQRSLLQELIASADPRSSGSQGPIYAGVVPNLQTKLKNAQSSGLLNLLDSNSRMVRTAQNAEFYGGQRDEAGQFLGFMVDVTPQQLDDNEAQLQVRVWRYLREVDANPQVSEFALPLPELMSIPSGGGAFIAGALPRRTLSESERRYYDSIKVLRTLNSEEFRSGATDLIIIVEPK